MRKTAAFPDTGVYELAGAVRRFCDFMERPPDASRQVQAWEVSRLLHALYVAVAALARPEDRYRYDAYGQGSLVPDFDWTTSRGLGRRFADTLGPVDLYWEYFDPHDGESALSTLASTGLAEIYDDIKPGLAAMDLGTATSRRQAARHWVSGFAIHWGNHLVDVLRVLHRIAWTDED